MKRSPDPGLARIRAPEALPDDGQAQGVHTIPEEVQHRRKEGEGGGDGDDPDDHRPSGQAAQDVRRHQEHA